MVTPASAFVRSLVGDARLYAAKVYLAVSQGDEPPPTPGDMQEWEGAIIRRTIARLVQRAGTERKARQ
jgi:hypothetical protein